MVVESSPKLYWRLIRKLSVGDILLSITRLEWSARLSMILAFLSVPLQFLVFNLHEDSSSVAFWINFFLNFTILGIQIYLYLTLKRFLLERFDYKDTRSYIYALFALWVFMFILIFVINPLSDEESDQVVEYFSFVAEGVVTFLFARSIWNRHSEDKKLKYFAGCLMAYGVCSINIIFGLIIWVATILLSVASFWWMAQLFSEASKMPPEITSED